jgi:hypothetical protein
MQHGTLPGWAVADTVNVEADLHALIKRNDCITVCLEYALM